MAKQTDKQAIRVWEDFYSQFLADVEVDTTESSTDRELRMRRLEADDEAWFAYYFPKYCTAPSANFHRKATKRLMANRRWYEVRAWSRELAKSARSMFEVLKLALTGETANFLLVSNSYDNACRLLTPFRLQLEKNLRIINDYGMQMLEGKWEVGEFTAKCGCAFRALGAGQSPRGTRNESKRPDFILIDDIDTDEECRNPDRIKQKWDWIEQALIPTVSVSGDIRILFNGNIIAKDCCIVRAGSVANYFDIVNIRDKHGKSTWEKNSEQDIDFILSKISTKSAQQEYYNNPLSEGDVFKEMTWRKIPPLHKFPFLCLYGDPSPSNNKNKINSMKSSWLMGMLNGIVYVINGRLDRATNSEFIEWYVELCTGIPTGVQVYNMVENNSLQDPFYEQVLMPMCREKNIFISPDERKKPDKFSRIEGNLEPLNRQNRLVLNIEQKENPHFKRLEEQFLLLTPQLKAPADGPDCVEGGYWWLNQKLAVMQDGSMKVYSRKSNPNRI